MRPTGYFFTQRPVSTADRQRSGMAVGCSEMLDPEYGAHETNADDSNRARMRQLWNYNSILIPQ